MSIKYLDITSAVDTMRRYLPESVELLAHTNIKLLVLLLQNIEQALVENANELKNMRDQVVNLEGLDPNVGRFIPSNAR